MASPRLRHEDHFRGIRLHDNVVVGAEGSRKVLAAIGIGGEILRTAGHSDDSVTLLLDNGFAFTGDLPHPSLATAENAAAVAESWRNC
jgi:ribonuclease/clavin/mitogillin